MFRIFEKWLELCLRRKPAASKRQRNTVRPQLELLENRLAPVIGSIAIPAPVVPGGFYDGVAMLTSDYQGAHGTGTGSLIEMGDGHYILTVAHNNPTATAAYPGTTPGIAVGATAPGNVTFNLRCQ